MIIIQKGISKINNLPVELQKNIEEQERQNERLEKFIQKAKHYQDLNSLTPDALRDMVSAIYVGAPDKSSGKRRQKIEIYYDGAGFIPLNLLMQRVRRDRSHAVLSPKIGTFNFFLFYGHRPKTGGFQTLSYAYSAAFSCKAITVVYSPTAHAKTRFWQ